MNICDHVIIGLCGSWKLYWGAIVLRSLFCCWHFVLLYPPFTDGCTSVWTTVHCCANWNQTYTHSLCTHYAWISCTVVRLYCSPVTVHINYRTCQFVLTNESPSKITFMNRVDQSQLWFLSIPSTSPLMATCWPRPFCLAERAVVKNRIYLQVRLDTKQRTTAVRLLDSNKWSLLNFRMTCN